eukprot:NODE_10984_length_1316_cov_5.386039.p9 GENE.NODE_10984_length_1316_cov_5.386039~~NODE_10984_length_1316_cov_5.386039.p9  ORF type:complete len:74 (-),score=6.05 NODE_10984_length_1316_cov_5.386039:933-1154(-)
MVVAAVRCRNSLVQRTDQNQPLHQTMPTLTQFAATTHCGPSLAQHNTHVLPTLTPKMVDQTITKWSNNSLAAI